MRIIDMPAHGGNFSEGRAAHRVRAVVIHISEGSLASMTSWFRNPAAKVSAHYGVGKDGTVVRYVDESDTAWHAGRVVRPTHPLVLQLGGNPNLWSIGIEHEGRANDVPPGLQMLASASLLADICRRHDVPLDRDYIIGHREIRADKTCPGKIDVSALIKLAKQMPENGEPEPQESPTPRDLRLTSPNMRGPDVARVQRAVGAAPDGIYGPQTEQAVMDWQRANGLLADGWVGPRTRAAMEAAGLI